ncbi:Hypothetical protein SRAE_2000489500 [Strongyloides ratti]|uniref:ATP synthase-coupling factor 6, mitochondrial n=1 Tax=Strongyloides ratti TaxID=34506 RepID=A0A090LKE7_STRRB|nr:Hypothetical protein SRAE_2000489500 [Strongyloides ratti]CEF70262.1 Hypothetical protein SRAE_2000489500 [Strongyloides ratti]
MNLFSRALSNHLQRCQRFASKNIVKMPKFSESKAYYGYNKFGAQNRYINEKYKPSYYDTTSFGSVITYFVYLREENDLNIIFNTPGHILSASIEKKLILAKIEKARANGEDTKLLEEELAYVDIKKAALKAQLGE